MRDVKGYLVAIGGAEDKGQIKNSQKESNDLNFLTEGVLKDVQDLLEGREPMIGVITTASSAPEESYNNYKKAFKKLGVATHHLHITTREEAEDPKVMRSLEKASGVMITGGDQARLSSTIGGTLLQEALQERYRSDYFVIAGTSAGAACMSAVMMGGGGDSEKGNIKGEVELSVGMGFISNVIIDTHFDSRQRFARLAEAIANQPGIVGIGLGEDTGIIVERGTVIKAIGSDSVTVIDGSNILYNNIAAVEPGKPISIVNLSVSLLARFDQFDLKTRKFTPTPAAGRIKKE